MIRQRLDEALVARMLYPSRARSRDAVLRGLVRLCWRQMLRRLQAVCQAIRHRQGCKRSKCSWVTTQVVFVLFPPLPGEG